MKDLHYLHQAQYKYEEHLNCIDFFVDYLEKNFNVGTGAYLICNYLVENHHATDFHTYDQLATYLADNYDVYPK